MINDALIEKIRNEFGLEWHGIHGVKHWARVRNNGLKICKITGANQKVVELFAFIHDSRRLNEGTDAGHGRRASEYINELKGYLNNITREEIDELQTACVDHSMGFTSGYSVTVLTCWDADRLDLGRVGIMPNPKYLCTTAAKDTAVISWAYMNSISNSITAI